MAADGSVCVHVCVCVRDRVCAKASDVGSQVPASFLFVFFLKVLSIHGCKEKHCSLS